MQDDTIHIIIVNYNNPLDTIQCIEHVFQQDSSNWNVFIVDNGSQQDEFLHLYDSVRQKGEFRFFNLTHFYNEDALTFNKLNLIRSEDNLGYGAAVNIVLHKIKNNTGYCFLLNPDVLLEGNALSSLKQCAEKYPESIIGCKVLDVGEARQLKYLGGFRVRQWTGTVRFITQNRELQDLDAISGGSLLTSCKVVREVGLFPEHYFLYWEDADWCRQAKEKGISLTVCEEAIAYDKGSTTIGTGYLSEYYYTLNALRYVRTEGRRFVFSTLASNFGRAVKRLLQFRFPNFRAILTASFHYVIKREPSQYLKAGESQ